MMRVGQASEGSGGLLRLERRDVGLAAAALGRRTCGSVIAEIYLGGASLKFNSSIWVLGVLVWMPRWKQVLLILQVTSKD